MNFGDTELNITPVDVDAGNKQFLVREATQKTTKYGIKWVVRVKSVKDGEKWSLWLNESDVRVIKRAMKDENISDVENMTLTLGTEEYINKEGQTKRKIVVAQVSV
jgi:hypothetical protein